MSRIRVRAAVLHGALQAVLSMAVAMPETVWAGSCGSGELVGASFERTVRPALAVDINPDPDIVEVELTAMESRLQILAGLETEVYAYNGVIPGPIIEAKIGDRLIVHFCNDLPVETTVHWHGVETPANMDGSNMAQLKVPPGGTFRYEFPLLEAGTFWFHPHVRTHRQCCTTAATCLPSHRPTSSRRSAPSNGSS